MQLFTEHCAGCHQIVARGGVAVGARVPPLDDASPVEIAEAVRAGPYVMPRFTKRTLSDAQLNSIVRYVDYAKNLSQAGGWGIAFIGPVPEGIVTWLIAAAALVAVCIAIGTRLRA
jgi:ubiquinol-cytochrome c reductase cytochrome c subunit